MIVRIGKQQTTVHVPRHRQLPPDIAPEPRPPEPPADWLEREERRRDWLDGRDPESLARIEAERVERER